MRGVPFESCDVANDVDAAARLRALGLRSVPVVAVADTDGGVAGFAFGVDLESVAELVGIRFRARPALPVAELKHRLAGALENAMRLASEFPPDRLHDKLPRRDRTCLALANHVVEIAAVFLRVCDGTPFDVGLRRLSRQRNSTSPTFACARGLWLCVSRRPKCKALAWSRPSSAGKRCTLCSNDAPGTPCSTHDSSR